MLALQRFESATTLSKFANDAIMEKVARVEAQYNGGEPFEPIGTGVMTVGRRMGEKAMTRLNYAARETLQLAGLTSRQWAQRHGYASAAEWRGDECGCPDDRCIGHHHDESEECRCLPALIGELRRDKRKLAEARAVWAAHVRATESGTPEDGAAAAELADAWGEEYAADASWFALSNDPRGIVYRGVWNDSTRLIYNADRDSIDAAEVTGGVSAP